MNTLVFIDLPVSDTDSAQKFYESLFGWQINPRHDGDFRQIVPGEGLHLGLFSDTTQIPDPAPSPPAKRPGFQPRTYILVDDAPQAYLDKAVQLGATKLWDEGWWQEFNGWHASVPRPVG